jgi:hypothetical protein
VYGEWGECKKQAHDVSRSCTSECHQYRTVTVSEKDKCTGAVRVKRTYQESKDCACPPPPPPPQGICHVSNKGLKDGNWNLVLSPKQGGTGHELHLDATKFCPPDHSGACSCEKAIADAKSCGIGRKTSVGFKCKIEGDR